MRRKLTAFSSALIGSSLTVAANSGPHHMMESPAWGWHWSGALFMVALWVLVILAIILLTQKIIQNKGDTE